jgi:hypothetical protein
MLKRYEPELLSQDWRAVDEGLEVRLCPAADGAEVFILCHGAQRPQKEQAMLASRSASKRDCSRSRRHR